MSNAIFFAVAAACASIACSSADREPGYARAPSAPIASPPVASAPEREADPNHHNAHHGPPAARIAVRHLEQHAVIEAWKTRYPVAAAELVDWARDRPRVAHRLCAWDDAESDRVALLTEWAVAHPYESLDVFRLRPHAWRQLGELVADPELRAGLDEYVAWARRNPDAALELVMHPRGLGWARGHVVETVANPSTASRARR